MKDFAAEIRASMDVENFLNSAILLLNLDEASIDAILDRMLRPLIVDNDEPVSLAEAKRAIFTHDSGKKSLRIFLWKYLFWFDIFVNDTLFRNFRSNKHKVNWMLFVYLGNFENVLNFYDLGEENRMQIAATM